MLLLLRSRKMDFTHQYCSSNEVNTRLNGPSPYQSRKFGPPTWSCLII